MALVLKDRVRETTTVLGTSDATLLGAVTGFQAFSVVGNGNTCYYTISDHSGGNWEVGIGTYSTVGPTLARTTILASSNSGSIVSFPAGTKDVFLTYPAETAVVSSNNPSTSGYLLQSNGTGVAPSWVAPTAVTVGAAGSNTQVQFNSSGVLGASSNFTFDGTNIGLAGGTANGVAYLNGSKVLTTGSALTFDGSKLTSVNTGFATSSFADTNGTYSINYGGNANSRSWRMGSDLNVYGDFVLQQSTTRIGSTYQNVYSSLNDGTQFWSVAGSEQMRLTSTGLGIGTSSPALKLDVAFSSAGDGIRTYNTLSTGFADVRIGNNSNNNLGFIRVGGSAQGGIYQDSLVVGTGGGYPIKIAPQGTVSATFDTSGNLGLGVTPSGWVAGFKAFQLSTGGVVWSNGYNANIGSNHYYNGSNYIYAGSDYASRYQQVNGAHQWYTAPSGTAGNAISFTQAMTLDASGNLLVSNGNISGNDNLTLTAVASSTNGTVTDIRSNGTVGYVKVSTSGTERMRIDSSGNVLVGKTATTASVAGMYIGSVGDSYWTRAANNNYLTFYNSGGTQIGYIQNNANSTTTYSTSSDYRLKENIQPMQNALGVVAQLNPVTYTWKADGSDGQGFIAHELQAVVPDCVTGEKDAVDENGNPKYQGVDTSFLVATLCKAIQELKAELDATKAEVAALKGA